MTNKENSTKKDIKKDNINNEKRDDIGELYNKINFYEKSTKCIFYMNLIVTILAILSLKFQNFFIVINILLNVSYILMINIIDMYLKNTADTERRKGFIKNSFNVNITNKETVNYYNNNEKESIKKMGINCFENLFFTSFICDKMVKGERIKLGGLLTLYTVLLTQIKTLKSLIVLFNQTLFFLEYIIKYMKFCYFRTQVHKLYDDIYTLFITSFPKEENELIAKILDITINYECLKYYCKISLSSKIFNKYNPYLSKEWDILYKKKIVDTEP